MGEGDRPEVVLHRLRGSKKAQAACALIEALYADGRRVAVWVADPGRAAILDQYLWTFSQSAFVPHARWDGSGEAEDPVVIVSGSFVVPGGADTLLVVDRLPDPAAAAGFAAIHDLDAGGPEDAGKEDSWREAGFEVAARSGAPAGGGGRRRR